MGQSIPESPQRVQGCLALRPSVRSSVPVPVASPPRPIRSALFVVAFYVLTATACVVALPALLVPGGPLAAVRGYARALALLERAVLGLSYEVRGLENLPLGGCIVAAKHYSTYETLKLHLLLPHPAIVLKRELLRIPLWGWFLARAGAVPIDRSRGVDALRAAAEAAQAAAARGQSIVIFPQGTRVAVTDTPGHKPYRPGVAQIAAATGLPVVPLAMNSGVFWPRGPSVKRGGVVVFRFLEPLPAGLSKRALMATLEERLEAACAGLVREALAGGRGGE
ncbi:MAG: 1-acyl-sn-glycerol-3-phosphate acyltransferase [Alphaproteobacteria bacterium]|nr:1-acyl-sn-glycerol-3-phosphate acyltransferase [Alphaproteobacteria bacterium]